MAVFQVLWTPGFMAVTKKSNQNMLDNNSIDFIDRCALYSSGRKWLKRKKIEN